MNRQFIKEVGTVRWITKTIQRQIYKRIMKKDHAMKLPSGEKFILPINSRFATEAFITNADVDWGSEALFFRLLTNRGDFLDIGANIGYYSLYMVPKVRRVYCFEPDPRTLILLQKNVEKNKNIHVVSNAVSEKKGRTNFVLETNGEVSHLSTDADPDKTSIEVEVTTIDDFVRDNTIDVEAIKIDIEGFDIDAIRGAYNTLLTQRPIVLTEAELSLELLEISRKVNYEIFAFIRNIETRNKRFEKIDSLLSKADTTKMLFLVPKEFEKNKLYS